MGDWLGSFFAREGFLPHGYCVTWSPALLWSMVGADGLIALAYFSIPLAIVRFVQLRRIEPFHWVAWMFGAFIFACGLTHVMDVWTIWNPDYGAQSVVKMVTAGLSVATAVLLWPLLPQLLRIPSVVDLQRAVGSLETEVGRRRTAEQHLIDVEQSLAVTLASIGAGFVACDDRGRVTRMNAVAERITGWNQSEAQGHELWEVCLREGRPAELERRNPVEVLIEQQLASQAVRRAIVISRQGARTAVEVHADLTRNDDGSVRGLVLVLRDVTRVTEAEAELRRLAAIVESSGDAIIGKTLDGRITSWNQAAVALFGYRAEEAVGQPVQMLIPPEREAEEMRILADLAQGRTVAAFDTQRLTRDGRRIDVSVTISPIRDASGRIVGGSKIARDVTQQRRAAAALKESEARLRFALESAEIGDWEMDLATGVMRRSARYDRCFGYLQGQPRWSLRTFLRHLHADDRDEALRGLRSALVGRGDWHVECRVVWPDASLHWISVHGRLLRDLGGGSRIVGIVSDITAARQAEAARLKSERLEAENRQIQEANRLKSQFLANMSHELRTPLNAVIGFADLLHTGAVPVDSPKRARFLGHIASSGRHLLQLINDVLDLSKVEAGKLEFFPEPVELATLVREVGDVLHHGVERKRLRLTIEIDDSLHDLELDPARLKQALYNYLSNAIKFTPEGGRVVLRARPEGRDFFRVEVEDSGIGIAPDDVQRLFVEFQQLDTGYSKRHQGTGLGLALTRRLVQAQGGSVGVHSQPGVGSVFHLVLPRRAHAPPRAPGEAPLPAVLVVEHHPPLQARWQRLLAEAGLRAEIAASADEAVRLARRETFVALTLDLMLPDRSGLAALLTLRNGGPNRLAPVVGLSMPADSGSTATFAIADLLAKPLKSDQVLAAVERLMPRPRRVLVVDPEAGAAEAMAATLAGIGIETVAVPDPRQALREIDRLRPDAMVLALVAPEFDGLETLDALQQMPIWRTLPVLLWTRMILTEDEYARLARSARSVLVRGGGTLSAVLERLRHRAVVSATAAEAAR